MVDFSRVPIVEISSKNAATTWPLLVSSIYNSTFLSLDLELSGLGDKKGINDKDVEERFKNMSHSAKTRAVVSLGISCFKKCDNQDNTKKKYDFIVRTFNILVLCSEHYVVEPASLRFLVSHGFDFNKQYSEGIFYYRGNDKPVPKLSHDLRHVFQEIIRTKKPIVLHNAFVDLVFLYHSFYAELPSNLATFLADLSEIFEGGIFDTKYISEFHARFTASYLEYIFKRSMRENAISQATFSVQLPDLDLESDDVTVVDIGSAESCTKAELCQNYVNYGWCSQGNDCPASHSVDRALDHQQRTRDRKNAKRCGAKPPAEQNGGDVKMAAVDDLDIAATKVTPGQGQSNGHRAGFDAFMTGYALLYFLSTHGRAADEKPADWMSRGASLANKIALTGKDFPLCINKSSFAKTSKQHYEKMAKIER